MIVINQRKKRSTGAIGTNQKVKKATILGIEKKKGKNLKNQKNTHFPKIKNSFPSGLF